MSTIIDFKFNSKTVKNPDGSLTTTLPADCAIVYESWGSAVKMSTSSAIQVDISKINIKEARQVWLKARFAPEANFTGEQYLLECGSRLTFTVKLIGDGKSIQLVAETKDKDNEIHTAGQYSRLKIPAGQYVDAEVGYDQDTLILCATPLATSGGFESTCHGFGPNSSIKITAPLSSPSYLKIGGSNNKSVLFRGKLATMQLVTHDPTYMDLIGINRERAKPHWYITTRSEMMKSHIGAPTSMETLNGVKDRWSQPHERGMIIYHPGFNSAYEIYGQIYQRYLKLSDIILHPDTFSGALMGRMTSGEIAADASGGRKNDFENGAIYWTSKTGAFEVYGYIFSAFSATGGLSRWGYPKEPPSLIYVNGVSSYTQNMEQCTWYVKPASGSGFSYGGPAYEIHGCIRDSFYATGGLERWGFPITNELDANGPKDNGVPRVVKVSEFERASIYWSAPTGAHIVEGDIRQKWLELGGPRSPLGLPVSDKTDISGVPGARVQSFEHGHITTFGGKDTLRVIYPFHFFFDGVRTENVDGAWYNGWSNQNDLWFTMKIIAGGTEVLNWKMPEGKKDNEDADLWMPFKEVPVLLTPKVNEKITMESHVYDNNPDGARELGAWTLTFDVTNAWGLKGDPAGLWSWGPINKVNSFWGQIYQQVPVIS